MTIQTALYATQVLMALAFVQQSVEHLASRAGGRVLFSLRFVLSLALLVGILPVACLVGLAAISLVMLHRFQGPYNGGSDKMSVLILYCLLGAHLAPVGIWQDAFMGYLALQLILSYFISGKVKLTNPDWRSGQALQDVFAFSAYPVSQGLRRLAQRSSLMKGASWVVIGFEVAFPIALIHPNALHAALAGAAFFHLANACVFGLNRFLWIWLAAFPSLLWLQGRVLGSGIGLLYP